MRSCSGTRSDHYLGLHNHTNKGWRTWRSVQLTPHPLPTPPPTPRKSRPILTGAKHMMWLGGTWLLPVTTPPAARNLKVCSRKRTNALLIPRPDLADPPPAATARKVPGRVCQTTEVPRPASNPELPHPGRRRLAPKSLYTLLPQSAPGRQSARSGVLRQPHNLRRAASTSSVSSFKRW